MIYGILYDIFIKWQPVNVRELTEIQIRNDSQLKLKMHFIANYFCKVFDI